MDKIEAISIVKAMLNMKYQMVDYFYSGDKDTFREAYTDVMESKGLKEFYDADVEERRANSEKYSKEIEERYDVIVSFGKELKDFYDKVYELLNDFEKEAKEEDI